MASYSLRRAGSSRVLVSRDKVSFCLRDNYKVPAQRVVVPRRHFGRCSRNSQQGISPGWVDLYKHCFAEALFQRRCTSRELQLILASAKPAVGPFLG
jgi:hypothetical protein